MACKRRTIWSQEISFEENMNTDTIVIQLEMNLHTKIVS